MVPDDRVLVAYVPFPDDFRRIVEEHWYRIPVAHAPKGLHAEYLAFYFGSRFETLKWAVHYVAPNRGHELVRRTDLIPDDPDHPRAGALYYKISLGPIAPLPRPIVSLRWRRILFLHTTWDRLQTATEIRDLLLEGDDYVNRKFVSLHDLDEELYLW